MRLTVKFILPLLFISLATLGQERQLGTWKIYMNYYSSNGLADAGDKVYVAGPKSVFSYEKSTGVIQNYDKVTGLSEIGVKAIGYDKDSKFLVIAYNSSNIDLIYNGTDIYNISDIKAASSTTSISIYSLSFNNGNCYVSTDMGISVINLAKKEISNNYIIGQNGTPLKVYSTAVSDFYLYAATPEGVKYAPVNAPNLQDFNAWLTYDSAAGLPNRPASFVSSVNNRVYAVIMGKTTWPDTTGDAIYKLDGATWQQLTGPVKNDSLVAMGVNGDAVYFSTWDDWYGGGKNGKIDAQDVITLQNVQGHSRPNGWFQEGDTRWEADFWNGFFKADQGGINKIVPEGPFSGYSFRAQVVDHALYLAPGGADGSWGNVYNQDGFSVYENDKWTNIHQYDHWELIGWFDFLSVASVPSRNKTYFGSFYTGLVEMDNTSKALTLYDKNSPNALLEGALGDSGRTRITCLYTDKNNNLWIGSMGATKPIKVITANGTWKEFSLPFSFSLPKNIIIDQNNQLWAPLRSTSNGLLVWSYNNTLDNPGDDKSRVLSSGAGNGGLPDANVNCVVEDKDGNIWAGTNQGIATFYCPGSVLTTYGCDADLIKVERDGYIGYLFSTETVLALAVDAANRKWVGTSNGLWLISADGKKELLKFNIDNSPLPANQVTDIAIDDQTGEVFICTTGGLVSYQGDAIGNCEDCDEALVYPNPVKPGYDGPIAIKGLTENAYVKITDVSGILVYQGKANGSQMIWDGKRYNGNRVASGIYIVYSSTDLGKEKMVAKILVSN